MRALVYDRFTGPLTVRDVTDPTCPDDGVVLQVGATGVCRSDWHGWQGHDSDITAFPHVPGHELAGTVVEVGPRVTRWSVGDRVTTPFVLACGTCSECADGNGQVCRTQRQPGFHLWGSFAELIALPAADVNLVRLPEQLPFRTAAALGCRYATAYRAVAQVAMVEPGEWVVVHGCGGVGLSAVQVAVALGARVVAVDVSPDALALATVLGAEYALTAPSAVRDLTGGAHVSLDAFGSTQTCLDSIACLRPRGRHIQVGLLPGEPPPVPMARVLAQELQLLGSHGMAATSYDALLQLVTSGILDPGVLVTRQVALDGAAEALELVGSRPGMTVVVTEA